MPHLAPPQMNMAVTYNAPPQTVTYTNPEPAVTYHAPAVIVAPDGAVTTLPQSAPHNAPGAVVTYGSADRPTLTNPEVVTYGVPVHQQPEGAAHHTVPHAGGVTYT